MQITFVTHMVLVQHMAIEHIGDGCKPPVRMVGKTCDIVRGIFGIKLIQQQYRVEPGLRGLTQAAFNSDTGAIAGGDGRDNTLDTARL